MKKGEFEKATRWVGGAIMDVVPSKTGADQLVGMFAVGFKLQEGHNQSRNEMLQKLREYVVDIEIFGDDPAITRESIQGRAPEYAVGEEVKPGALVIDYRRLNEGDIPPWPGLIKTSALRYNDREEIEEKPDGNI